MHHVPTDPPSRPQHRIPRARIDPIDSPSVAEPLIDHLVGRPLRHETLAITLDRDRCGVSILAVDGTRDPDAVLDVAELVIHSSLDHDATDDVDVTGAVILVSVRPPGGDEVDRLDDFDRWLELDELFGLTGIQLVEWFVVGERVERPRALLGDAPRWCR